MNTIRIQMMDFFAIYINETRVEQLIDKSKKGAALMQYLILNRGKAVQTHKLMETLWSENESTNPESALKTLVSRMRSLLNQVSPDMGKCIVSEYGSYRWVSAPNMTIDMYEIEDLLADIASGKADTNESAVYERLIQLYKGDLLQHGEHNGDWLLARSTRLHNGYIQAVYSYVERLKMAEDYVSIASVCRTALDVDNFDDHLHMELMSALVKLERTNEAMIQYKHVMNLYYNYLGIRPSEDMQEFYKQIVSSGKTLELNLESIRNELRESSEQHGAFICEYVVFKEIFNLQMRNLERLGSTMFLGVIMVSSLTEKHMEPMKQDKLVQTLMEVLRVNLRKGDTVTHFSPTIVALLLPMVNYSTGRIVMERIKKLFYQKCPNSNVAFNYRIGPLSSDMKAEDMKLPTSYPGLPD